MKILKSKLLVALMIGGLMSGMLSFSTVSIIGQDTSSTAADLQPEPQNASFWKYVVAGFKAMIGVNPQLTYAIANNNTQANDYPTNALD